MSRIKIDVRVMKEKESKDSDAIVMRELDGIAVNLFDSLKENIAEYGEGMVQACFIGTSGKVALQNQIRTYATEGLNVKFGEPDGEPEHDDKAVQTFADSLRVTVGQGGELQKEVQKEMDKVGNQKMTLDQALAIHKQAQKTARETIAKRKETAQ